MPFPMVPWNYCVETAEFSARIALLPIGDAPIGDAIDSVGMGYAKNENALKRIHAPVVALPAARRKYRDLEYAEGLSFYGLEFYDPE
ncbi:MAG: hypothetical protein IH846_18520 [Acidobacteria bacterium]|nr:hypothetical protein [Acidobacteriota bacterium]